VTATPGAALLIRLWRELQPALDGGRLVRAALAARAPAPPPGPRKVLALGKVAAPMFAGLEQALGPGAVAQALLVTPPGAAPGDTPARIWRAGDHPVPGPRSEDAARAACAFVEALAPPDQLLVLLSGGGSALAALPAPGLALADKRAATTAVARAGAGIFELNAVRKHLSAIKGGQLAARCRVPATVLVLSDVVGDDLATIASGPLAADPTTFADALAVIDGLAAEVPGPVRDHLVRGARGERPETLKPGDPRLALVHHEVLAGPDRVPREARRVIEAAGVTAGVLSRNVEAPVPELAAAYGERAQLEQAAGGRIRVLVGNGEPRIVVRGAGRGGRSTHLALLMARALAGLEGVAFLAAGTDDRDGSADAVGAVVDGRTWGRAVTAGLEPELALVACDSASPLGALGCLLPGTGTSNLLDLHLLLVGAATPHQIC
jgi:glycerate 2-kinase